MLLYSNKSGVHGATVLFPFNDHFTSLPCPWGMVNLGQAVPPGSPPLTLTSGLASSVLHLQSGS